MASFAAGGVLLDQSHGFRAVPGGAVAIDAGERQVIVTVDDGDERARVAYDLVVVAVVFQARWFAALFGRTTRLLLEDVLAGSTLEQWIAVDLLVSGLSPPLHLPVVAGAAQGRLPRTGAASAW